VQAEHDIPAVAHLESRSIGDCFSPLKKGHRDAAAPIDRKFVRPCSGGDVQFELALNWELRGTDVAFHVAGKSADWRRNAYLSILRSAPGQRPVISEAEMSEQLLQAVSRIVHKQPEMNQSTGAAAEHHLQKAIRMVRFSKI